MRNGSDARDSMFVESCSSSMACDMEEVGSESSRKMRDKEETTFEVSWTAVTKGKEKELWRLEPEGEAEKLEATAPWNGMKGLSVNLEGGSRHGQVRAKFARKERKNQTKMEEKVDGEAPSDEGAEIQSPERKVIRVESEETQDYVRESLNLSREGCRRNKIRAKRAQHSTRACVLV